MSKVIAIMDKPTNCQKCVFGVCEYSLPLSMNRKGYCCQLISPEQRKVHDVEYGEDIHIPGCPLKELTENMAE